MEKFGAANWIPYKLNCLSGKEWTVNWLHLSGRRMTEPFFDDTIRICKMRQRENGLPERLSSAGFLEEAAYDLPSLQPSAFVFHVSRCGSTLLSQAFTEPEENVVIAEAPLLDEILRSAEKQPDISSDIQETWLKAALQLMGQQRNFKETNYIIKLDSWHIHFYEQLRKWFPQTPFFFLYRKPNEVLASHQKQRGIHTVPGMVNSALLKIDASSPFNGDFNSFTADVLQQYYLGMQRICELNHPKNLFFDYADGVKEMIAEFSAFTGITVKDETQVNTRLGYHSKSVNAVFKPEPTLVNNEFFFESCNEAYEQLRLVHHLIKV